MWETGLVAPRLRPATGGIGSEERRARIVAGPGAIAAHAALDALIGTTTRTLGPALEKDEDALVPEGGSGLVSGTDTTLPDALGPAGGYDEFAWLYDREWGATSLAFLPALDSLVLDALPVGSRVLDLCCGTGQLAAVLSERGYGLTGLDISPQMLALARSHAPRADFVLGDARSFSLTARFDAVVSVYDSLNHIMSSDELREVFDRVHAVLVPGGRFVFDLMTEEGYPVRWEGSFVGDGHAAIVRSNYDPGTRTMRFEATLFRPSDDRWERTDVVLLQRCHAEGEVRAALAAAGFVDVAAVPATELGARQPGRLFYAASA